MFLICQVREQRLPEDVSERAGPAGAHRAPPQRQAGAGQGRQRGQEEGGGGRGEQRPPAVRGQQHQQGEPRLRAGGRQQRGQQLQLLQQPAVRRHGRHRRQLQLQRQPGHAEPRRVGDEHQRAEHAASRFSYLYLLLKNAQRLMHCSRRQSDHHPRPGGRSCEHGRHHGHGHSLLRLPGRPDQLPRPLRSRPAPRRRQPRRHQLLPQPEPAPAHLQRILRGLRSRGRRGAARSWLPVPSCAHRGSEHSRSWQLPGSWWPARPRSCGLRRRGQLRRGARHPALDPPAPGLATHRLLQAIRVICWSSYQE